MKQLYVIMSGKIGKKGSGELRIKPVAVLTRKHEASAEKKRLQELRPNTEYWIEAVPNPHFLDFTKKPSFAKKRAIPKAEKETVQFKRHNPYA